MPERTRESRRWKTGSAAETRALGFAFGEKAAAGEIYALSGGLGAGKTVFAQGFAEGLGVTGTVNSPTFTILKFYETGRLPLVHMDAYRLEEASELEAVGGHEYLGGPCVCLIEWPEMIEELLPPETIRLRIDKMPAEGPDVRVIAREASDEDPGC